MAPSIIILIIIITPLLIMISSSKHTAVNANHDHRQIEWTVVGNRSEKCSGGDIDEELEVDSESSSRRILAGKRYVSYGALERNNVPCSRRGASYYNCRQGAQANPYTRGCNAITRCRS